MHGSPMSPPGTPVIAPSAVTHANEPLQLPSQLHGSPSPPVGITGPESTTSLVLASFPADPELAPLLPSGKVLSAPASFMGCWLPLSAVLASLPLALPLSPPLS